MSRTAAIAAAVACAAALVALPRAASAKGCHEVSNVVGLQHCTRYGTWSRDADQPRLFFDVGFVERHFMARPFSFGTAARAVTPEALDLSTETMAVEWRMLLGLGRFFYTGFDIQGGAVSKLPRLDGLQPSYGVPLAAHAIVGAHVERFRIGLGGELAAGGRWTDFVYCMPGTDCKGDNQLDKGQGAGELEARLRVALFIHPMFSVDMTLGKSLVARDDTTFMLTAAFHIVAFDGMYYGR